MLARLEGECSMRWSVRGSVGLKGIRVDLEDVSRVPICF
jgi:hypothetical protein